MRECTMGVRGAQFAVRYCLGGSRGALHVRLCFLVHTPFFLYFQAAIESGGRISKEQAIAMGTTNILQSLGVDVDSMAGDLVATRGGHLLDLESKVAAVLSPRQDKVHVFV